MRCGFFQICKHAGVMRSKMVILAVIVVLASVPGATVAQSNTSNMTTATQTSSPTPTPTETETETATESGSSNPFSGSGFGIVSEVSDSGDRPETPTVEQQILPGVWVTDTEFVDQGEYAVITVTTTDWSGSLSATDSNSIDDRGSGKVAAEQTTFPPNRVVKWKVPASVSDGDQTVVIGATVESSYYFSDYQRSSGNLVPGGQSPFVAFGVGGVLMGGFVLARVALKRRERQSSVEVGP